MSEPKFECVKCHATHNAFYLAGWVATLSWWGKRIGGDEDMQISFTACVNSL